MASAQRNISRRVRFSYATSTVSMTLVLFLLGAVGFIIANLFTTTKRMRESVTMIVELKDGLSEAERDTVAVRLAESDMVASLKFVSKDEKMADGSMYKMRNTFLRDIVESEDTNHEFWHSRILWVENTQPMFLDVDTPKDLRIFNTIRER